MQVQNVFTWTTSLSQKPQINPSPERSLARFVCTACIFCPALVIFYCDHRTPSLIQVVVDMWLATENHVCCGVMTVKHSAFSRLFLRELLSSYFSSWSLTLRSYPCWSLLSHGCGKAFGAVPQTVEITFSASTLSTVTGWAQRRRQIIVLFLWEHKLSSWPR